jgi:hypothetical protein
MPHPSQVMTSQFQVQQVLYSHDDFAIGYGIWDGHIKTIAVRWNGLTDNTLGFPVSHGHPVWLVIPEKLCLPFIITLFNIPESDRPAIIAALEDIEKE